MRRSLILISFLALSVAGLAGCQPESNNTPVNKPVASPSPAATATPISDPDAKPTETPAKPDQASVNKDAKTTDGKNVNKDVKPVTAESPKTK